MRRHSKEVQALSYEVPGWGVGELYLDGERLLYHELPAARARSAAPGEHPLADRFRRYFAGERMGFEDVEVDLAGATPFQAAVAKALRRIPYGETVTYGELAALAGYPSAQGPRGRSAPRTGSRSSFPVIAWSPPAVSAHTDRSAARTNGACS